MKLPWKEQAKRQRRAIQAMHRMWDAEREAWQEDVAKSEAELERVRMSARTAEAMLQTQCAEWRRKFLEASR